MLGQGREKEGTRSTSGVGVGRTGQCAGHREYEGSLASSFATVTSIMSLLRTAGRSTDIVLFLNGLPFEPGKQAKHHR